MVVPGRDIDYPVILATNGMAWFCKIVVNRGTGRRLILSQLDEEGMDSMHAAITFAAINAVSLQTWIRGPPPSCKPFRGLYDKTSDVSIMLGQIEKVKRGNSGGACAALALVSLLGRCGQLANGVCVGVTGAIDLRGRLHPIDGVLEKCTTACKLELGIVIIPQWNYDLLVGNRFQGWSEGLKTYASDALKGATTILDMMELVIPGVFVCVVNALVVMMVLAYSDLMSCVLGMLAGFVRTESMQRELDGVRNGKVHLGVGRCLCLHADDGVVMEFQCCWVGPGTSRLIMSGNLSEVTRHTIDFVRNLVLEQTPAIAVMLGIPADRLPSLARPCMDLHVHCEKWFQPLTVSYHMVAAYVAMVSLLFNRIAREDTVGFASLNNYGYLGSGWTWGEGMLKLCQDKGIRRAVLAKKLGVSDEVRSTAAEVQDDGRPLVELIFWEDDIVKALPLFFDN